MADLFVALSVNAPDDPKILEAGDHAELVYYRALCLAKRRMSDGFIANAQLRLLGATDADVAALVHVGLWLPVEGGWTITAWLKHNEARADIEKRREAEKKRKADYRNKKKPRPDVPPDATGDSTSRDNGTQSEAARSDDSDVSCSESEVSVPPDATRDTDDLITRALEHFARTMGKRFDPDEIRTTIDVVQARGYAELQVVDAMSKSDYPSDLKRLLPAEHTERPDDPRPTIPEWTGDTWADEPTAPPPERGEDESLIEYALRTGADA